MSASAHRLRAPTAGARLDQQETRRASWVAEPTFTGTARLALHIAGVLAAAALVVALPVHLSFSTLARHWLGFPFTGLPAKASAAAGIFLHNVRALGAIAGLLLIAQSMSRSARALGRAERALLLLGEIVAAGAVAANVIVVGASLGAYGARMVRAVLPHGPFELAAYSSALALYLQGRRRPLSPGHIAAVAIVSVITLALAAVLETFVSV